MDDVQIEPALSVVSALRGASVTLVMPCLNEEGAIGSCVTQALAVMRDAEIDARVLVVDNGSSDRSIELAEAAGARVVVQPEPGYGAALRSGFEAADSEYVIMADGDGTYELAAIPKLLMPIINGSADVVLGSRLVDARGSTMPWHHKYIGTPVITYLVSRATGKRLRIRDSQSGFRAFRRDQILNLNLSSTGMEFASEMLIRCAWANLRITEIDTTYSTRVGESKLNTFKDGMRHLRQIVLLSPDVVASIPGMAMILGSIALWILAADSSSGLGRVGSMSWLANLIAGVLSVVGPIVFCTGLVMRYRAESSGLRHSHVSLSLTRLIRRMFWSGVFLLVSAIGLTVLLILNYHASPPTVSQAVATSVGSLTRSAYVDGIFFVATSFISPYLLRAPRARLPTV